MCTCTLDRCRQFFNRSFLVTNTISSEKSFFKCYLLWSRVGSRRIMLDASIQNTIQARSQCCGSGSGRISIICAYPAPFKRIVKLNYNKISMFCQKYWKLWHPSRRRGDKIMKLALLWTKVKKLFWFPTFVKPWVGSGFNSGSASTWCWSTTLPTALLKWKTQ